MRKSSIGEIIAGGLILLVNFGAGFCFLFFSYRSVSYKVTLGSFLLSAWPFFIYTVLFGGLIIYSIINVLLDCIIKKKEEVVVCKYIKDNNIIFVNEKGKMYRNNNLVKKEVSINKYYKIVRDRYTVNEVIEEVSPNFKYEGIKRSFWLTWYTPWETYRDTMYIPILYAICLIFMPFIIPGIGVLIFICYDLYTKYRIRIKEKELIRDYPEYTYEQLEELENNVVALDAPFFGRIIEFYKKYKVLLFIIVIMLIIGICLLTWK